MEIVDRIIELRRVPAGTLRRHPKNWRVHGAQQEAALRGALAEIGFADALLVRSCADGVLELIDGHLRAEIAADSLVPVLVLDVDEAEADKVLATHDPLATLAEVDEVRFAALRDSLDLHAPELRTLLDKVVPNSAPVDEPDCDIPESYELVVTCADEADQRHLFEHLESLGYRCRVLTL